VKPVEKQGDESEIRLGGEFKTMANHISLRQTQFSYFDQLLEGQVWKGRKILDFGGNVGGFLAGSGDQVDHRDYWCLDITRAAIEQGQHSFPRAHFVFYNRYSPYFNPNGVRHLPIPDLGVKFDIILAFSVFTHTHRKEMLELVGQLRRRLSPRGVLAFTFSDPADDSALSDPELPSGSGVIENFEKERANNHSPEIAPTTHTTSRPGWCVEIDDELYLEPGDELCQQELPAKTGESYCSYFTVDYMKLLFPDATMLPPVSPEWQHCCILRNSDSVKDANVTYS
jgi:SAM-dependent methyltransferase